LPPGAGSMAMPFPSLSFASWDRFLLNLNSLGLSICPAICLADLLTPSESPDRSSQFPRFLQCRSLISGSRTRSDLPLPLALFFASKAVNDPWFWSFPERICPRSKGKAKCKQRWNEIRSSERSHFEMVFECVWSDDHNGAMAGRQKREI
jgi:hypothetical protein